VPRPTDHEAAEATPAIVSNIRQARQAAGPADFKRPKWFAEHLAPERSEILV